MSITFNHSAPITFINAHCAQAERPTEEKEDIYAQWSDNVITQNIFERRITLGIRTRF